jgi:hypothetical protein
MTERKGMTLIQYIIVVSILTSIDPSRLYLHEEGKCPNHPKPHRKARARAAKNMPPFVTLFRKSYNSKQAYNIKTLTRSIKSPLPP